MKTGATLNRFKSKQDFATPWPFIRAVESRFHETFNWDLAASPENAKAHQLITEQENSLTKNWSQLGGLLWLNPPFGKISPWAEKCWKESKMGARIMLLTPASVGANWFSFILGHAHVMFLNPRLSFDGIGSYPKDLMLSYFNHGCHGVEIWEWK